MNTEITVLRLTRDVPNPKPDRRSKDWNLLPVIPAGTRLVYQREGGSLHRLGGRPSHYVRRDSAFGVALLAASEPAPLDGMGALAVLDNPWWRASDLIDTLVASGALPSDPDMLLAALRRASDIQDAADGGAL